MLFLYIYFSCSRVLSFCRALPYDPAKAPRLCKLGRKCVPAPKIALLHRQTHALPLAIAECDVLQIIFFSYLVDRIIDKLFSET